MEEPQFAMKSPAGAHEGLMVIGQAADGEAGEPAESEIEGGDERLSDQAAEPAAWHCEIRNDPKAVLVDVAAQARGERFHFSGVEAVEKEVGEEQIV